MKRTGSFSAALLVLIFVLSLPSAAKTRVEMKDAHGKSVGTITLSEGGRGAKGVRLELNLHDLPAGQHAIHIHRNAKCDGPDFKSAGPHFNPDSKKHGLENPEGHHAGDMMNFSVNDAGKAKLHLTNNGVKLGDGSDPHSLFANGGTAIVIHAKPDDMKTDPSGNAGDRIACGVVTE